MMNNTNITLSSEIDDSLSRKVSRGTVWVTLGMIISRTLNIGSAIILTRLLIPDDFGLLAIVMAIIAFSDSATQTGFESALIQKQDKLEDFLNTAWTFELARYLFLFFIIFLAAPLLASFFREPRAVAILRVISLSLVFQGLRNIGVIYFRKNLDFQKQFILEIVPTIAYISVVIPLAFSLRSVWALVWASLAINITTCCISYVMHPYRPHLDFSKKRAGNLFTFGKWVLGSSIIGMINNQGMTMFVGKFLGIPVLGFFNRAGVFSTAIFQQVSGIIWKVGYPAFSQLQDNPEKFKQAYLKTLQLLTFVGIPLAGGLFVLSSDFVHLFLTDKWLPIVPVMQILCLLAILDFINTPANIAFPALGRPALGTKISMLGVIILAITVYPLTVRWGTTGAVAAFFLSALLTSPIIWYMSIKIIKCSISEFFKPVLLPLINTGIMVSAISVIKGIFMHLSFAGFFVLIFAGIGTYIAVAVCFDRYLNYDIYRFIRERFAVLR